MTYEFSIALRNVLLPQEVLFLLYYRRIRINKNNARVMMLAETTVLLLTTIFTTQIWIDNATKEERDQAS